MYKSTFILFLIVYASCGSTNSTVSNHKGASTEYKVVDYPSHSLTLTKDNSFVYRYKEKNDTYSIFGKWQRNGSYFILNSDIQKDDIQLTIEESERGTKDKITFISTTERGDILFNCKYIINSDSKLTCKSGLSEMCSIDFKGALQKIQFFYKGTKSKIYNIENKDSKHLKVSATVPSNPDKYLFFKDEKFKIEGNEIRPSKNLIVM